MENKTGVELNKIYNEDCMVGMQKIADASVDMILTDLPYEMIASSWDKIIPLDRMWEQFERIIKDDGAIVLTASGSFATKLLLSNPKMFKYKWIWMKNTVSNFVNAKNRPLSTFEEVLVFSKSDVINTGIKKMKYRPQGLKRVNKKGSVKKDNEIYIENERSNKDPYIQEFTNYPKDVLYFPSVRNGIHVSQKPLSLISYLIKTYTDPGDIVLDSCMGAGTTGVACVETGRNFIGFEIGEHFCKAGNDWVEKAGKRPRGLW